MIRRVAATSKARRRAGDADECHTMGRQSRASLGDASQGGVNVGRSTDCASQGSERQGGGAAKS